jgi:hypothetical protein
VSDRQAHAFDLAVPTLVQGNPQPGGIGQFPNDFNFGRGRYAFLNPDTEPELFYRFFVRMSLYFYIIYLRYSIPGMKEAIGKFSIIGEQKKSFRVVVEPAHGKNPCSEIGQKIQDSPAAPGIGCGGYATGGLIEGENNALRLERNRLSVEANAVRQRIDAAAEFGPLTVHLNPALPDQFLGGASRADSSPREKFLKPHYIKKRGA